MALQALTFELRIMARKKRMLLVQHKSGFKRILTFKACAQEAKGGQPLAPILGQVQINVGEFVHYFNEKTQAYPKGLELNIKLFIKWDKSYYIEIGTVPLTRILSLFVYNDLNIDYTQEQEEDVLCRYKLYIVDFFKVVKIYANMHHLGLDRSCCVVFSQLHLFKISICELNDLEYNEALAKVRDCISYDRVNFEIFDI